MGVKIRKSPLSKGRERFYLDVSHKGKREKIYLDRFIFTKPKSDLEKIHNRVTVAYVNSLASEKETELVRGETKDLRVNLDTSVIDYAQEFVDSHTNTSIGKAKNMRVYLMEFAPGITFREMKQNKCIDFCNFLKSKMKGDGARHYWLKFRKMMTRARADRFTDFDIRDLPKDDTKFHTNNDVLTKDTLTPEEFEVLAQTPCPDNRVKHGFLFMYYTGLAYTDLYHLEVKHIRSHTIAKPRQKSKIWQWNELHPVCEQILKVAVKGEAPFVFDLPNRQEYHSSYDRFRTELQRWVKAAGIKKHITPHCARHSLGTNIEADLRTIASIMGHSPKSGFSQTFKYVHARDDKRKAAMGKLKGVEL